ncbi:hypothetical protein DPEC_G00182210 [Dallia pectoralis]|uniref:Uncharacterized protein n=1 Tax=Dallia pectoralis TaxID=75939 RepID=A0ACC2GAN5_DALPE|nr:hypothetical protein DPEC_G00182210 [Dallia pectoralis]
MAGIEFCNRSTFGSTTSSIVENMCRNVSEDIQHIQDKLYTAADSTHLILGFPTNVYVLWLIGNRGKLASDFFALNLTVVDILTCMSSLMFILHDHIYCPQEESGVLWGTAIFFNGFILAGRPLFQCCICLERYMAIVQPGSETSPSRRRRFRWDEQQDAESLQDHFIHHVDHGGHVPPTDGSPDHVSFPKAGDLFFWPVNLFLHHHSNGVH